MKMVMQPNSHTTSRAAAALRGRLTRRRRRRLRRAWSSSARGFSSALFRVQPRWTDQEHYTSALSSMASTLTDLDLDLAENVFPGTVSQFQYGGYQLSEILAPFLHKFTYASPQDQQRVLQLAFLLDKKFILRAFDSALTADALASRFEATATRGGGGGGGTGADGPLTLSEDVSGGMALAPAPDTADDTALAECLGAQHYAGKEEPPPAASRNASDLIAWSSAECDAYLTAVRKTCNVCFVDDPSPAGALPSRILVSTTDIPAGTPMVYADGLAAHLARMRGVVYAGEEEENLLREMHAKFLPRERHVMGSSGMLERNTVSGF